MSSEIGLPMRHLRQARRRAAIGAGLGVLLIFVGVVAWYLIGVASERRFDSAVWRSSPVGGDADYNHPVRQRMVDNLLRSKLLMGKTRAEVESLLGPPENTSPFRNFDMVYRTGPQRNSIFRIDDEWLAVTLDAQGRVSRTELVTD